MDRSLSLFFLLGLCAGCVDCENVATGTNYTFKSAITGAIELGDWRLNGNIVVEWEGKNEPIWYRLKDQATLNPDNKDLTVTLKKQDSGVYKAQFQVNGVLKYYEITMKVIDPVTKPKVTCEQNDQNITLKCSLVPPVQAQFKWTGPNGFSRVGDSIQIDRNENDDSVYYCTAENEVSTESAEFKPKPKCFSKDPDPDDHKRYPGAIVGAIIGTFALIGLATAGFLIYKMKVSSGAARGKENTLTGEGGNELKPSMENETSNNHSPDDGATVPLSKDDTNQDV